MPVTSHFSAVRLNQITSKCCYLNSPSTWIWNVSVPAQEPSPPKAPLWVSALTSPSNICHLLTWHITGCHAAFLTVLLSKTHLQMRERTRDVCRKGQGRESTWFSRKQRMEASPTLCKAMEEPKALKTNGAHKEAKTIKIKSLRIAFMKSGWE